VERSGQKWKEVGRGWLAGPCDKLAAECMGAHTVSSEQAKQSRAEQRTRAAGELAHAHWSQSACQNKHAQLGRTNLVALQWPNVSP